MKIQCNGCGASFEADATSQHSVECPYCGNAVSLPTKKTTPNTPKTKDTNREVIPFAISEEQAIAAVLQRLIDTDKVPYDVFQRMSNVKVEKYALPMFVYEGTYDVAWSATSIVEKSRKYRDKNGNLKTEYYDEYYPISGNAYGGFSTMLLANGSDSVHPEMRRFTYLLNFTDTLRKAIKKADPKTIFDGCTIVTEDISENALWKGKSMDKFLCDEADYAASRQITGRYSDLRTSWNANYDVFHNILMGFYFITYTYNGRTYYSTVDGYTGEVYQSSPQDENTVTEDDVKAKRFSSRRWLYILLALILSVGTAIYAVVNDSLFAGLSHSQEIIKNCAIGFSLVLFIVIIWKSHKLKSKYEELQEGNQRLDKAIRYEQAISAFPQYSSMLKSSVGDSGSQYQELEEGRRTAKKKERSIVFMLLLICCIAAGVFFLPRILGASALDKYNGSAWVDSRGEAAVYFKDGKFYLSENKNGWEIHDGQYEAKGGKLILHISLTGESYEGSFINGNFEVSPVQQFSSNYYRREAFGYDRMHKVNPSELGEYGFNADIIPSIEGTTANNSEQSEQENYNFVEVPAEDPFEAASEERMVEQPEKVQDENEWLYGTWTCRVVQEAQNSYIGSVTHSYKLIITGTNIQVFVNDQKQYDGSYSIEDDRIIYYVNGTRQNIRLDRGSHRLRLYGDNYYSKS